MNFPILLVFLYALPLGWYMRKVTLVPISFALHSFRRVPLLLGVFCIMFVAGLQYFPSLNVSHRLNSILIYNRGYLNWDKPTFGKYGFRASGMFGMLAENMMSMGYHVEFDSTLTEKKLGRTSVVVMINLNQQVPVDQKERLKRFVKKGGSLLVMGDHTGLAGTMAPLNGILDFTGIEFKFDCGHYLKKDWRDSFQFASHTIFKGVRDEIDVGISVGASLKISPITARPLILGKYAFSDNGDILNTGNGYLGDRLYNQGELLGDIVLVAEAMYGNGKVLVFGDTSSFQNGSVVWDFRFLQNIFGYLISSAGDWSNIHRRLLVILLCLCAVVVVLFPGGGLKDPSIVVWLTVTILLVVGILSLFGETQPAKPSPNHRIAYIDASHLNRFTQYGDDGIWALSYHLMRNNHIPIVVREFSPQLLRKCSVAFFINPAASIQTDVLATIDEYVKNGGVVVWSVGNEEKDAVANVMAAYGFDIDNIPLGPVPVNETSAGIQFSKAWPIQIRKGENIDTLCSGWGYPVIGSKNVAKGKVVLIADPLFLLSENLEANHKLQNSNHLFLRMITNESNAGPVVENTLTSVPLSQISKKDGMIR